MNTEDRLAALEAALPALQRQQQAQEQKLQELLGRTAAETNVVLAMLELLREQPGFAEAVQQRLLLQAARADDYASPALWKGIEDLQGLARLALAVPPAPGNGGSG